ncbi:outer membrane lipoprotein-sorting protein [Pelagibius sp. Alg239-R121]|uniref:outer membrane lipoprotein-sorting protein n=1 Tax=Pelagibius sp. Alg239-R121 TaxID=2993448 RepID=UPI0024A78B29|nr:outer membrane lipoprotein-sorting protein [Pelagibius sp. Alg239-R121]
MIRENAFARRFFMAVTAFPKTVLFFSFLAILGAAAFLPLLNKDTTPDAFIAADNPAVIYRDKVKEIFGLDDPFVVAVIDRRERGIYNPVTLGLVQDLSEQLGKLRNVDPDRVTSLATESNIVGTEDGMEVDDFYELGTGRSLDPAALKAAIEDFPLYQGALVARDGSATLIVAEVIDHTLSQSTYDEIRAIVDASILPEGVEVHVAGEGAISGFLGTYIDNDATRLNPLTAVVITLVLVVAFRTFAGALLPNIIVLATAAAALGLMAAFGVSFFVITNGLLPILIGIAVADSIHVLSDYYELAVTHPELSRREVIVRAMQRMYRPITLTTLTTIAGFMGLFIGAEMPPMKYFGLFAAIGVTAAWFYTILVLPAAVTLFKVKPSNAFALNKSTDVYGRLMTRFGHIVLRHPRTVVAVVAAVAITGAVGASRVIVEESQIENFQRDEPIYLADQVMNQVFDGTNYIDMVVETPNREDLFKPDNLARIEALQRYAETLDGVQGSTSVVDYIKQMHKAVNENRQEFYSIPDDDFLIAQLFLLYSTSANPTDFEEEVDYDYRRANIRLNLNSSLYRSNREVIAALEDYVAKEFIDGGMTVNLSGRVYVNFHWLNTIGDNHLRSLTISLVLVWLMASLVFRSALAGAFALIPVGMSILLIYAVMGFSGIWLGVGTSMFAAIAIGLGIDFSIHTIDRMKELAMTGSGSFDERIAPLFPSTGRALFFNFAAIGLGFAVLTTSEVPPLLKFGVLVGIAVAAAFIASMAIMPALAKLLKPRFIWPEQAPHSDAVGLKPSSVKAAVAAIAMTGIALLAVAGKADAEDLPDGREIMQRVVDRDEGEWVTRTLIMEMTDRSGTTRKRETAAFRRYYGQEKRTVMFYKSPTNVKGTGFLTYDYPEADKDDDQWLYLPALRKVRRISASDRGDYFLGTDLTYEDMKKENKVALEDYDFTTIGQEKVDGHTTFIVEGVPVSEEIANELGYSKAVWRVDSAIWISREAEMWDVNGNPLKTIRSTEIEAVDGIWTVHRIHVENHKTRHQTLFRFGDIDYKSEIKDKVFKTRNLKRGL